jgi:hypothetical protein
MRTLQQNCTSYCVSFDPIFRFGFIHQRQHHPKIGTLGFSRLFFTIMNHVMNRRMKHTSRFNFWFALFALLASLFAVAPVLPARAQTDVLVLLENVESFIDPSQPEEIFTFNARANQYLAVRVQATSGDLSPVLEIYSAENELLAAGEYFGNATSVENFVVPADGTYTVRVTGQADSSGNYTLSLLPGYSTLLMNDTLDSGQAPLRVWSNANASSEVVGGMLRVRLSAESQLTYTTSERISAVSDLYFGADMRIEESGDYWESGLAFRATDSDGTLIFYVFFINAEHQWRVVLSRADGLLVLQDWTDLPGESAGFGATVNLGVMTQGDTFTLFYNGDSVGTVQDGQLPTGTIGVAIGTSEAPSNFVSSLFDNFVVTLPITNEEAIAPITLSQWNRVSSSILGEIANAGLIRGEGTQAFALNEAFVTNNTAGSIVFVPLVINRQFGNFVYSADVFWDSNSTDTACAFEFRTVDEQNFSIVYFDRKGGYGIRQIENGEVIVSDYNLSPAINVANRVNNRLTVIAFGERVTVYINGILTIDREVSPAVGTVSIAAYNYADASNYCQFVNLWLRSFD